MTREIELRIGRLNLVGKTPAEARAFIRAMERALAAQLATTPMPPQDTPAALPRRQAVLQAAPQPRSAAAALHRLVTK